MSEPFGDKFRLHSQTGYNLTIRSDGSILGTQDDKDDDALLLRTGAGAVSHVRIQAIASNLYVCFDEEGNLYGEADKDNPGTVFEEQFFGDYTVYKSAHFPDWFIGIKKSGVFKPGPRTKCGQKATKFLPRRFN